VLRRILVGSVVALLGLVAAAFSLRPTPISPEAIRTSVVRRPALIARAWQLPAAAAFRHELASQSNPSVCGPASLANVFRSLGEPATREDQVLAGSGKCLTGMCFGGLTLDELAGVARKHTNRAVTVLRDLTPDRFRAELRRSNDPRLRYVVNFTRKPIFHGGGGHHSPIGGYLEPEDLVFVLDVNRDFGPWLIAREQLFAAIDTRDGDRKRGLLRVEAE
jgi:hypothetical protein